MEIQEQTQGAVQVLKPAGPLVAADAQQLKTLFDKMAGVALIRMLIDASAISFVDSAGIETLVDITDHLGKTGKSLKLCNVNPTVRQVLDLTGWSQAFEFYDDVNAGVRSFL